MTQNCFDRCSYIYVCVSHSVCFYFRDSELDPGQIRTKSGQTKRQYLSNLSSNPHSHTNSSPPIHEILSTILPPKKNMKNNTNSIGSPAAPFPHWCPPHWGLRLCSAGIRLFLRALDGPHRKGPFDSFPWLSKGWRWRHAWHAIAKVPTLKS